MHKPVTPMHLKSPTNNKFTKTKSRRLSKQPSQNKNEKTPITSPKSGFNKEHLSEEFLSNNSKHSAPKIISNSQIKDDQDSIEEDQTKKAKSPVIHNHLNDEIYKQRFNNSGYNNNQGYLLQSGDQQYAFEQQNLENDQYNQYDQNSKLQKRPTLIDLTEKETGVHHRISSIKGIKKRTSFEISESRKAIFQQNRGLTKKNSYLNINDNNQTRNQNKMMNQVKGSMQDGDEFMKTLENDEIKFQGLVSPTSSLSQQQKSKNRIDAEQDKFYQDLDLDVRILSKKKTQLDQKFGADVQKSKMMFKKKANKLKELKEYRKTKLGTEIKEDIKQANMEFILSQKTEDDPGLYHKSTSQYVNDLKQNKQYQNQSALEQQDKSPQNNCAYLANKSQNMKFIEEKHKRTKSLYFNQKKPKVVSPNTREAMKRILNQGAQLPMIHNQSALSQIGNHNREQNQYYGRHQRNYSQIVKGNHQIQGYSPDQSIIKTKSKMAHFHEPGMLLTEQQKKNIALQSDLNSKIELAPVSQIGPVVMITGRGNRQGQAHHSINTQQLQQLANKKENRERKPIYRQNPEISLQLFEKYPIIQFDITLRSNRDIQKILISSQLGTITNKLNQMAMIVVDKNFVPNEHIHFTHKQLQHFNLQLEITIGMIYRLGQEILQDIFRELVKRSQLKDPLDKLDHLEAKMESVLFKQNCQLVLDHEDYLKACVDCYTTLVTKDKDLFFQDKTCILILTLCEKVRYNLSVITELVKDKLADFSGKQKKEVEKKLQELNRLDEKQKTRLLKKSSTKKILQQSLNLNKLENNDYTQVLQKMRKRKFRKLTYKAELMQGEIKVLNQVHKESEFNYEYFEEDFQVHKLGKLKKLDAQLLGCLEDMNKKDDPKKFANLAKLLRK